jgi:hypothetical protein
MFARDPHSCSQAIRALPLAVFFYRTPLVLHTNSVSLGILKLHFPQGHCPHILILPFTLCPSLYVYVPRAAAVMSLFDGLSFGDFPIVSFWSRN